MRKHKFKQILILSVLPFALAACNVSDVQAWGQARGIFIEQTDAARIQQSLTLSVPDMIRERWAGTGHAEKAIRVARCESGFNPRAKNRRSSASGVFQLTAVHWRGKFDPYNARANIDYAFRLWQKSGWRPWVCRG